MQEQARREGRGVDEESRRSAPVNWTIRPPQPTPGDLRGRGAAVELGVALGVIGSGRAVSGGRRCRRSGRRRRRLRSVLRLTSSNSMVSRPAYAASGTRREEDQRGRGGESSMIGRRVPAGRPRRRPAGRSAARATQAAALSSPTSKVVASSTDTAISGSATLDTARPEPADRLANSRAPEVPMACRADSSLAGPPREGLQLDDDGHCAGVASAVGLPPRPGSARPTL